MKIISVLCFALCAVLLFLAVLQVITRGWGPLDVSVLDFYFVILPIYSLWIAGILIAAGLVVEVAPRR